MHRMTRMAWLALLVACPARAAEVSGWVAMPEVCAPEVSPAVVVLEPADGSKAQRPVSLPSADIALIDQRGLQFVPRVVALRPGQGIRFTNSDAETHSVHAVTPGFDFNQSMAAGQSRDWVPEKPGVVRLACDVHSHMRGYLVVAASPWVAACGREGKFRLDDVPDGRYVLNVWHEMGNPLRKEITVARGKDLALGTLTLTSPTPVRTVGATAPVRPWRDVIDRISLLLASSIDAATRPGQYKKARRLVEDAYFAEFEASDMEAAVRTHLGFSRKGELEAAFFAVKDGVREVSEKKQPAEHLAKLHHTLFLELHRAAQELDRKGVTDGAHIFSRTAPAAAPSAPTAAEGDREAEFLALRRGFDGVRALADRGEAEDAASEMATVYARDFEPLERRVDGRNPLAVGPLERTFNAIRGDVGEGLKGEKLTDRLDALQARVRETIDRTEAPASGGGVFGAAFASSLLLILREGVEVILLLTMLIALASRAGRPEAMRAIRWGVGLAVLASAVTAWGLNRVVASAKGPAREMVEGLVMLAAAGVLFYVSYWLISQSESKRWMDFLKRQAKRGAELGGFGTLALTAFLALYREGAETALLYQAMIGAQGQTQPGLLGLVAGLGVGLVLLCGIALAIRATSVRLPLRAFFQVSGVVLFALAVVFAGNGIFELQSSGILKITPMTGLSWLGEGIPALGLYPTVQTVSVQGLLLAGAGLALVLILTGERPAAPADAAPPKDPSPSAGVGVGA